MESLKKYKLYFSIFSLSIFIITIASAESTQAEIAGYPTFESNENLIINTALSYGITNYNQIAYMVATARHETASFRTLEEFGQGEGQPYGIPDPETGQIYYGRGYVQLTWRFNYETYASLTERDLLNDPDILVREPELSAWILVDGMMNGRFTGRKLSEYIHNNEVDFYNARRTVNGTVHADIIENYAKQYVKNDTNNTDLKTYKTTYSYHSYKSLDSKAYYGSQELAGKNTIYWESNFQLNLGQNTFYVNYNNSNGSTEQKKIILRRHRIGDINGDNKINARDLLILRKYWLIENPSEYMSNLNPDEDDIVDILDLSIVAKNWDI